MYFYINEHFTIERTLKKAPQKPPTAVNVRAEDLNTVTVTWRYVAPSIEEETLSGYKVFYIAIIFYILQLKIPERDKQKYDFYR